tara:strand:+ start:694 stop:894 length:201 start_codon:yes stop_codon:yes gene_type:complete
MMSHTLSFIVLIINICFPSGEILNEFLLGAHAKYSIGINPSSENRWVEYDEISIKGILKNLVRCFI